MSIQATLWFNGMNPLSREDDCQYVANLAVTAAARVRHSPFFDLLHHGFRPEGGQREREREETETDLRCSREVLLLQIGQASLHAVQLRLYGISEL